MSDQLTDEEANMMIARLKMAGKYSNRSDKVRNKELVCSRCTKPRHPHSSETCYFKDKVCRVCKQVGHMGGSKMCSGKAIKRVSIEKDFDNPQCWEPEVILEQKYEESGEGITIRAVRGKNTVNVKVGGVDTEMFVDSGAEVSIVPTYWYKKEMGKLQPSSERWGHMERVNH